MSFFSKAIVFPKTSDFITLFVFLLMIVNDNLLLAIINDNPSLMIVNIIVNIFFQNNRFFKSNSFLKNNRIKNGRKLFCIKTIVFKTDRYSFQNKWVVFKINCFFPKMKQSFLKTIEKQNKKQSFSKMINKPSRYCPNFFGKCKTFFHNDSGKKPFWR